VKNERSLPDKTQKVSIFSFETSKARKKQIYLKMTQIYKKNAPHPNLFWIQCF
jgi:hypothetical protein